MLRLQHSRQQLAFIVALLFCASLVPAFEMDEQQQTDPYVFRTETALVRLDVSVQDAKGNPIPDLMPSDFEVRQDGKQQRVVFAEFRQVAAPGQAAHDAGAGIDIASSGRRLVIVVDDLRMSFESVVRVRQELLAALLQNSLPDDQMMIVGTRGGERTVSFTRDPVVLGAQVEALRWEAPTRNNQLDAGERRRSCMDAPGPESVLDVEFGDSPLAFIASAVSDLRLQPGRKIILLLADGINDMCPEYRWQFDERLRRLTDLAARSASIVYALQTPAFSSGVRMPDQRGRSSDVTGVPSQTPVHNEVSERMKKLAEPTGGYADRSNSIPAVVTAALKDSSSYYVLAYEPPAGTFTTGKVRYHRLEVRVSRRGATVRTREGFYSIADSELIAK